MTSGRLQAEVPLNATRFLLDWAWMAGERNVGVGGGTRLIGATSRGRGGDTGGDLACRDPAGVGCPSQHGLRLLVGFSDVIELDCSLLTKGVKARV